MNADEKRKVFEELLEEYQDVISSEFSYEDGEREAERRAWLNKYDGIKEPLIKDKKIRKAVRAWAEACAVEKCHYDGDGGFATRWYGIKLDGSQIELDGGHHAIAELCGEEEE